MFWESTGYRIIPRDELGQKLVFSKTGPTTQMVQLESDLIGIFYLRFVPCTSFSYFQLSHTLLFRFYTLDSTGKNVYISEAPEVIFLSHV